MGQTQSKLENAPDLAIDDVFLQKPLRKPKTSNHIDLLKFKILAWFKLTQAWKLRRGFAGTSQTPKLKPKTWRWLNLAPANSCLNFVTGFLGNQSHVCWLQPMHHTPLGCSQPITSHLAAANFVKAKNPLQEFFMVLLDDRGSKFHFHFLADPQPQAHHIMQHSGSLLVELLGFLHRGRSKRVC